MSIYDYGPILAFCVAFAACLGAICGSFLNCAAFRIVRGEPFVKGHSRCPTCGHELGPLELIPVLSWLVQGGRCKWCKAKISPRYPLTELAFALITVLCLLRFDLTALCLRNWVFLGCLFLLTLTDLEAMLIPDGCHIAAIVAWVAALPFVGQTKQDILFSVITAAVLCGGLLGISLILDKILGRDSLGGGDIKLLAVVGLYLGPIASMFALMLACAIGLLFHALARRRTEGDRAFPFGPSIALTAAAMLLYGEPLVNWYRALL
ncbi:MAG: prepilin peptidase [Clostridia bacterium]|nr:prepilin peptidase [Clostridia bacterium]